MKTIHHKVYLLEDEEGKEVDMSNITSLNICVNDKLTELEIVDVFKKFEGYEKSKVVGWSILEFFKFEDGYLLDEDRNKISFYSKELETELYVKKIRNAIVMLGDIEIKDAYIRDVKKLLVLSKGRITEARQEAITELKEEIANTDNTQQEEPVVEAPATPEPVASEPTPVVQEEPAIPSPVVEVPSPVAQEQTIVEVPAPIVSEPVVEAPATPEPVAQEPTPVAQEEPAIPEPVEQEELVAPEPEKDSYELLKRYYTQDEGYTEYVKDDFRLLYKIEDAIYLIKLKGDPMEKDSFEQIHGDLVDDNEKEITYEYEVKGKTKKITFQKAEETVSE